MGTPRKIIEMLVIVFTLMANICLDISPMSTKVYKNPCNFVNIDNNPLYWKVLVRVLNGFGPTYKDSFTRNFLFLGTVY